MNVMPPPGPERRRLLLMVVALVVMFGLWLKYGRTPAVEIPTSTGPAPTALPTRVQMRPRVQGGGPARKPPPSGADAGMPQALRLTEMENQLPDEPQVGRNPFRFGEPPPPKYVPPPPAPPPVYTPPPPPPGPPPIPLKLTTVIADPYQPGRLRAYLTGTDPKTGQSTGMSFEAIEGQIVDGRYKLLKVSAQSVVVAYLDGTGQRTLTIGG